MSKSANAGELRTPVWFKIVERFTDAEGYPNEDEVDVFDGSPMMCKWVNAHGTDAFLAMQQQLKEPATITCRYSPKINERCLVYKDSDPKPFEVISIDNVEERNVWLEIKVQRRVAAR